jgi:hypothetical protein
VDGFLLRFRGLDGGGEESLEFDDRGEPLGSSFFSADNVNGCGELCNGVLECNGFVVVPADGGFICKLTPNLEPRETGAESYSYERLRPERRTFPHHQRRFFRWERGSRPLAAVAGWVWVFWQVDRRHKTAQRRVGRLCAM